MFLNITSSGFIFRGFIKAVFFCCFKCTGGVYTVMWGACVSQRFESKALPLGTSATSRQGFPLAWSLPVQREWLVSKPQHLFPFPNEGFQAHAPSSP